MGISYIAPIVCNNLPDSKINTFFHQMNNEAKYVYSYHFLLL